MNNLKFYRAFSIISFFTSWAFGLIAAYLDDFYPKLEAFHALFVIKTFASSGFWIIMTVQWFQKREEKEDREKLDRAVERIAPRSES